MDLLGKIWAIFKLVLGTCEANVRAYRAWVIVWPWVMALKQGMITQVDLTTETSVMLCDRLASSFLVSFIKMLFLPQCLLLCSPWFCFLTNACKPCRASEASLFINWKPGHVFNFYYSPPQETINCVSLHWFCSPPALGSVRPQDWHWYLVCLC